MRTTGLLWARARSSSTLLLTIVVLAAAMTAIIAGTLGYSGAAATQAARDSLRTGEAQEAAVLAQTRLAGDPAAQQEAAEAAITEIFGTAPVVVQRTVRGEPIAVEGSDLRVVPDAGARYDGDDIEIVDGERPAPDSTDQGLLQADAAALLGLRVGDVLTLSRDGEHPITVTGLWRAAEPEAPLWFDDPLIGSGIDGEPDAEAESGDVGPLVLSEAGVVDLGGRPFARFIVLPDPDAVSPSDLTVLAAGAAELRTSLQDAPGVNNSGITVEGDLAPTTSRAALNLQTAAALNLIPVTLLLAVSLIALVQIARLLAQTRARETEVMIARGATVGQFARWSLTESVVLTVIGGVLGTAAALLVVRLFPAGSETTDQILTAGVLVLVAVLATLVVVAALRARAIARLATADRSGRLRAAAALGTVVLAFGAAAFTLWQLRRYGSPLVPAAEAGGTPRGDLIAGAAPTLLLMAGAVLAMALLGPVTRLVDVALARGRRVTAPMAAAQVSRRLSVYVVPVILTVLAVGATTVSGLYAGTSGQLRDNQAQLALGTDVRVLTTGDPTETVTAAEAVDGVTDVAPVTVSELTLSGDRVPVLVVPADSIGEAVRTPVGGDAAALREAFAPPSDIPILWIPDDAEGLEFDVEASAPAAPAASELLIRPTVVGSQIPATQDAPSAGLPLTDGSGRGTVSVDLPVSDSRALTSIGLTFPAAPEDGTGEASVTDIRISGGASDGEALAGWDLEPWENGRGLVDDQEDFGRISVEATGTLGGSLFIPGTVETVDEDAGFSQTQRFEVTLRFDPPGFGSDSGLESIPDEEPEQTPTPMLVTRNVATAQSLEVGSQTAINVAGFTVPGEVVAVVDAVPGVTQPSGVLVGAESLDVQRVLGGSSPLTPNEVWIATDDDTDPADVAAQISDAGLGQVRTLDSVETTDVASAVRAVFWVASIGATLLAAAGIGAVGLTLLRERRSEVAVLRALGMVPGGQATSRALELFGVASGAGVLGGLAGWAASALTIPSVASSTDTSGLARVPAPLAMEWPAALLLAGLLLLALLAVCLVIAGRVRAQALDNEYREEVR